MPFALTRADRELTGADFDVESITRRADGTYWMGDEFGPFLLHPSTSGRLLEAPIPLDGRYLYPLLEGSVAGDTPGDLRFSQFDLRKRAYTGRRFVYRTESPSNSIGDATAVDKHRFLVIERDGGQGDTAKFKRIYLVDTPDRDGDGLVDKTLVADLLDLTGPKNLGGFGDIFRFPFQTIEDVTLLDDRTIAVLNDNNFPFSPGRTPGAPDDDEFITVRLASRLHADERAFR
ncbi:esterase-like activity of phytase family protein [Streptomyces sp. NPDC007901]|uniref:esterase-like activity of phytase family protein n=1 Tax=Streptomyces sp. NPDC007901 TaxID=3364785 RepID=UPI0036E50ADD